VASPATCSAMVNDKQNATEQSCECCGCHQQPAQHRAAPKHAHTDSSITLMMTHLPGAQSVQSTAHLQLPLGTYIQHSAAQPLETAVRFSQLNAF
jgi:hypothetical protein